MNVLLIEPYYGGSHKTWADGYKRHSQHEVTLLTLPDQFWKWRMQGGAVTLARLYQNGNYQPDVILASDMFNLATFRALTQDLTADIPIALYFHETQLTYPQNTRQKHGWQYAFVNYISALSADRVFFNSPYHLNVFFENLPRMLKHFADYNELQTVDEIRQKSAVLPLGVDLKRYDAFRKQPNTDESPLILWNHRWEDEKNPRAFFSALYALADDGIDFRVALTGENVRQEPHEFEEAKERLREHIVQFGYVDDFSDYARLLWESDYVVSTAHQEFFGGAVAEAVYCGCVPILPNRLNYPHLLPTEAHTACLYRDKGQALYHLLRKHLTGEIHVDVVPLQQYVSQFDWSVVAPLYDKILTEL